MHIDNTIGKSVSRLSGLGALGDRGGGSTLPVVGATMITTDRGGPSMVATPYRLQTASDQAIFRAALYAHPGLLKSLWRLDGKYPSADTLGIQNERRRVLDYGASVPGTGTGFDRGGEVGTIASGVGGPIPTDEDRAFALAYARQRPDLFQNKSDWLDKFAKVFEVVVEAIVIAGIAWGGYLAATQAAGGAAAASGAPVTTTGTATVTTVTPATLETGVVVSAAPATVTAVTPALTPAAGLFAQATGYAGTAGKILSVAGTAQKLLNAKKLKNAQAALPATLDTQYGYTGTAPVSRSNSLTTGLTPWIIGGGAALLALAFFMSGKKGHANR